MDHSEPFPLRIKQGHFYQDRPPFIMNINIVKLPLHSPSPPSLCSYTQKCGVLSDVAERIKQSCSSEIGCRGRCG